MQAAPAPCGWGAVRAPGAARPPDLPGDLSDLGARLTAFQTRMVQLETDIVRLAEPLPAYRPPRTSPGVGPTLAAILLAELGDLAGHTQVSQLRKLAGLTIQRVASGQARISRGGTPLRRWADERQAPGIPGRDRASATWRHLQVEAPPGDLARDQGAPLLLPQIGRFWGQGRSHASWVVRRGAEVAQA